MRGPLAPPQLRLTFSTGEYAPYLPAGQTLGFIIPVVQGAAAQTMQCQVVSSSQGTLSAEVIVHDTCSILETHIHHIIRIYYINYLNALQTAQVSVSVAWSNIVSVSFSVECNMALKAGVLTARETFVLSPSNAPWPPELQLILMGMYVYNLTSA